jgi:hypothetical protein
VGELNIRKVCAKTDDVRQAFASSHCVEAWIDLWVEVCVEVCVQACTAVVSRRNGDAREKPFDPGR